MSVPGFTFKTSLNIRGTQYAQMGDISAIALWLPRPPHPQLLYTWVQSSQFISYPTPISAATFGRLLHREAKRKIRKTHQSLPRCRSVIYAQTFGHQEIVYKGCGVFDGGGGDSCVVRCVPWSGVDRLGLSTGRKLTARSDNGPWH